MARESGEGWQRYNLKAKKGERECLVGLSDAYITEKKKS